MRKLTTIPKADGFRMPGEFEPHKGTIMIWPIRPGSWPHGAVNAKKVFAKIACKIAESEELFMLTDEAHLQEAERMLQCEAEPSVIRTASEQNIKTDVRETAKEHNHIIKNLHVLNIPSDDSWARDVGPTYVVNNRTQDVRGINWTFNAWGGTHDGLYQHWERDDAVAVKFMEMTGRSVNTDEKSGLKPAYYDAAPFVLEGGSIHADGEGTLIVTEACLLSKGRNPELTKEQIEQRLKDYLGAEKVIWLPRGIYNDETNEHVDNVCAYVRPGEVVLAWTDDESDPQYELSKQCLDVLNQEKDARGRSFVVHKMLIPENPVCITQEELDGFVFEEEEDTREAGERLAASYVNFYICNESVLVPQFGDVNDEKAISLLTDLYPDREVVPIYARDIIVGGGNIHCITQQIPMI